MIAHSKDSPPHSVPIIALLTDFGLVDSYVGVMKGIILSICPTAQIIDLTHAIQPQNIRQAAYVLSNAIPYLPAHTITVVVVDPGVGSTRKPIIIETDQGVFVGPDNGVFSYALNHCEIHRIIAIQNRQYVLADTSMTFHGRDIFCPIAAHIAAGVPLDRLGSPTKKRVHLEPPHLEVKVDRVHGEVFYIDHFGNVVTSIGRLTWGEDDLLTLVPFWGTQQPAATVIQPELCAVQIGDLVIEPLRLTYASVRVGEVAALINSAGHLEIAINHGNAAQRLAVTGGEPVVLLTSGSGERVD